MSNTNDNLTLSKRDFEALGCEDVPGPRLRARMFRMEGLVAELALTLEEIVKDQDRQGFIGPAAWYRAKEILGTVREKYNDILSRDAKNKRRDIFDKETNG
jgi:hypothetical protein